MSAADFPHPDHALRGRIERLQSELLAARARAEAAEHRAELARKDAAAAWLFAKTMGRCGRRDGTL